MLAALFLNGPGAGLYAFLFVSTAQAAEDPQRFLKHVAMDGIAEVELADVAQERARRSDVKQLAEKIKQDHQRANEQVKSLAQQKGAALPQEPDNKHKREKQRLTKLQGEDFDRAYINAMVKDHKHDIQAFEKEARDSKDPDVKAFAAQTVPVLREHLEQAQQLQKELQAKE